MLKQPKPSTPAAATAVTHELGSPDVIEEWVDATLKTALSLDAASYIPQLFWSNQTRPDGRIFGQARTTSVTKNVLEKNSIGSALVKLSSTSTSTAQPPTLVMAGVTVEIGQPAATQGDLKITCVPTNMALESWLQRLLIQAMDLEQLGILPGKAAFGLDVTLAVLNQDGNVTDACLLAAVGALCNAVLPPIVVQEGRVFTLETDEEGADLPTSLTFVPSKKLVLPVLPLPLSMGYMRIGKEEDDKKKEQQWLVDPSREEEIVCQGGITVVVDGNKTDQILSLDYRGQVSMTQSNLALALRMAQGRAEELVPLLQDS